ncbi:unnamed protein product [Durusdinium trenchii]|uniref:Uncharacterized protein n=1 Tax=Durusdinium trenchii TaxID=1381693 RepID=A0ABP0LSQ6_9DINO
MSHSNGLVGWGMGHADQTHPSSAPPLSSFGLELASHPRWTARSFLRVQLTGEEDESSIERSTRGLSHESSTFVEHFEGFLSCKFFQQLGGNWGNWCPRAPRAFDICFVPPRLGTRRSQAQAVGSRHLNVAMANLFCVTQNASPLQHSRVDYSSKCMCFFCCPRCQKTI